jgi:hypothetical protein
MTRMKHHNTAETMGRLPFALYASAAKARLFQQHDKCRKIPEQHRKAFHFRSVARRWNRWKRPTGSARPAACPAPSSGPQSPAAQTTTAAVPVKSSRAPLHDPSLASGSYVSLPNKGPNALLLRVENDHLQPVMATWQEPSWLANISAATATSLKRKRIR